MGSDSTGYFIKQTGFTKRDKQCKWKCIFNELHKIIYSQYFEKVGMKKQKQDDFTDAMDILQCCFKFLFKSILDPFF